MKISDISFSDDEISQLKEFRDKQKKSKLKIRFIALLMLATDASIENVSFVVGCTVETIKNWVRIYETKGAEGLNTYNYKPKKPYLTFSQISQVVIFVILKGFPESYTTFANHYETRSRKSMIL